MASLIPGYEYDIFISYRQKDNKGDRWVSQFVEALKTELEASFKEDVSLYFDENPHDRLQETHNVDKSLEGKLRCLIFIPILSQTYCDPNSYAWQYEFLAFNKLAKEDFFGRDIRLRSGNVASRILPIRIHDLDQEDITLYEKETGSVLRAVDFVFKTATGVSRPLLPNEDHPNDNLNKTFYRDQINKVAHAIKEIIHGMKIESVEEMQEKILSVSKSEQVITKGKAVKVSKSVQGKVLNKRTIPVSIIALALIIICILFIPKLLNLEKELEKSIAVLPFVNIGSDEDKAWFSDGITDIIINQLSKISELRVLGWTSTQKYKEEKKSITEIGNELGVNYIIEGTVQRHEDNMRISVQLIRVINEGHVWSDIYDRQWKDILTVESEIAEHIANELKTVLSNEEEEQLENYLTDNPEAYNLYLQGRYNWNKRTKEGLIKSVEYFQKAINIDTTYALAFAGLADAYFIQAYWGWIPWAEGTDKAKETVLKALALDKNLAEAHTVLGALYNYKEWKWEEARKELKLAVELNPKFVTGHHYYSELLNILGENEEARKQINYAMEIDPFLPVLHVLSSRYYYNEGKLKEALEECQLIEELDPEYSNRTIYWREFNIHLKQQEDLKALTALQKALYTDTLDTGGSNVVLDIYNNSGINGLWKWLLDREIKKKNPSALTLADRYNRIDEKERTLTWLEKSFEDPPPGFANINNNPDFNNLRSEPRFQVLIEKLGLSDYQIPK